VLFGEPEAVHHKEVYMDFQVVIIGGGPAAHNAALALGRSRKRVLICDEGKPRNRVAKRSHTFFTRDGTPPLELRQFAIEQLMIYDTVQFLRDRVSDIEELPGGFRVSFDGRESATTELVLLAVGMDAAHPNIPGFDELWGDTVIHCPYCHGWEVRDLPWGAYLADADSSAGLARLRSWSDDVIVIAEEELSLPSETHQRLVTLGYKIEHGTIRALHAKNGKLDSIELFGGRRISRKVLLYSPPQNQTALVRKLGLDLDDAGCVVTDDSGQTSVQGIYAAGDLTPGRQQIVVAAADGMRTAIAMDGELAASY
jgi:thioredoxin reductase